MNITLSDAVLGKMSFDPASARKYWGWLLREDSSPILCTAFGHLFLECDNGSIVFLDTWSGQLHEVCDSYDEFKFLVANDSEFFASFFWTELLASILATGVSRVSDQCFSPFISPGLGGSLSVSNFSIVKLDVHFATMSAEQLAIRGIDSHA